MTGTQTVQFSLQPWPAPAKPEAPGCSPQQASWWGVGEALEGGVLGPQEEGKDGSSACTQGVAHHNQAIVFGSTALETKRSLRALPTAC